MAQYDVYQYTLVGQFETVTINTVGYAQITDEVDQSLALEELADFMFGIVAIDMVQFTSDQFQWTNVITRRLRPAISDVFVKDMTQSGNLPSSPQSSTVYALMRYYCEPYEKSQSNHFKLTGLTDDAANRGVLTDEALLRYSAYIQRMTGSPWVTGQNTFALVRPPKDTDVAGQPLPVIDKMFPDGQLRNLRGRQQY